MSPPSEAANTTFRRATAGDAAAMAAYHWRCLALSYVPRIPGVSADQLDEQRWVDRFGEWFESEQVDVVVAMRGGAPVGHTAVGIGGDHLGHVHHVFVDPDHWRTGLGSELLAIAERLLRRAGVDDAQLSTIVGNEPAIALYTGNGWTLTDRLVDGAGPGGAEFKEHVLIKRLDQDHVRANRAHWNDSADRWVERGRRSWAAAPHWGEMAVPESTVGALPELDGRRVVELGCGTGYVSAWCLRAGASAAVGIDNSIEQLRTARVLQDEFDLRFPLVLASAEQVPLEDGSFDVAVSEYGAAIWCDPDRWIGEAARLLRPGGDLMFLGSSPLLNLCLPDFEDEQVTTELVRAQRGMRRFDWPDSPGVEFHVSHGDMIRVLRQHGFEIVDLIELYPPTEDGPERYSYYDRAWAADYPAEEMWIARRLA